LRATKLESGCSPTRSASSAPSAIRFFVAVRHDQIDLQARGLIEKGREKRRDPPRAIGRRQRDAQDARKPVGAARRVLGVLDGGERVAGPREQRFAGVCSGEFPRRPRDELDPQPLLQRSDRAQGGRLGQAELAG